MDTINRGGERPHLLTCGTNGSSQTRQGNSIPFEDIWGKNNSYNGWAGPQDTSGKHQNKYLPLRTVFITTQNLLFLYSVFYMANTCFIHTALSDHSSLFRCTTEKIPSIIPNVMHILCTNICIRSVLVRQTCTS